MVIAAGCATATTNSNADIPEARPKVVLARVVSAGWPAGKAQHASSMYALKCGRCHKFYDPAAYDEVRWQKWFVKMSGKAKLNAAETEILAEYLAAARR
jgi:hypothetical protein